MHSLRSNAWSAGRTTARVVVLGSRGAFTAAAVAALLERGVDVVALGVAGPPGAARRLPERSSLVAPAPPSAVEHAQAAGIPALELGGVGADVRSALEALRPDVMVLACFPWLIPAEIRHVPTRACVNIHPSLLPAYRGPVPLFWQFRDGAPGGVTVHHVDGEMDTGDVIAQAPIPYPCGTRTHEAEMLAASTGARLLSEVLSRDDEWPRRAQVAGGSRQGLPTAEARVIPRSWPARQAFDFIRGAGAWGPFVIEGEAAQVHDAIGVAQPATVVGGPIRLVSFADAFLPVV